MNLLSDEPQDLRHCGPDLAAFAAFPAAWADRKPADDIVESLADLLLHRLGLNLVYVCIKKAFEEGVVEAARVAGQPDAESVKNSVLPHF